ncbi:hypothetical protein KSF73_07825 [Burkholderiaceae bacterium DAT-1]|nr:hypothetical protein [Burkholderiaceae bacterium DAT-1]
MKHTSRHLLAAMTGLTLMGMGGAVQAATAGAPATPTIQIQNYNSTTTNNFTIAWNIWYGTNATSWTLYQNGAAVQNGTLTANGTSAQSVTMNLNNIPLGVYTYYVQVCNAAGCTNSAPGTTTVGNASLIMSQWDNPGQVLQQTVAQGNTSVALSTAGQAGLTYTVASNNPSVATASISGTTLTVTGKAPGRAGLRITDSKGNNRWLGIRVKNADGTLPGLPNYVSIGTVGDDTAGALSTLQTFGSSTKNTRADYRYIYLNGGASVAGNTSWCTWTTVPCFREISYIRESRKLGMIPVFVFYNIPAMSENYAVDLANIQSTTYMQAYFKDWLNVLNIANAESPDDPVGYVIEPDFLGYMMQQSGKQPNQIAAQVSAAYSSGVLGTSDPQFPNTVEGLVKAVNYIISKYSKNAWYGWQINLWADANSGASSQGLMHITDANEKGWSAGRPFVAASAQRVASYYNAAGITSYGASFISFDKYGYDAGASGNGKWMFNGDHWNNYLYYVSTLNSVLQKPVVLWQLPVGHVNGSAGTNPYTNAAWATLSNASSRNYEDTSPVYFFGDTFSAAKSAFIASYYGSNVAGDAKISTSGGNVVWGSHMLEAKNAGIRAIMFGAGIGDSTDNIGLNNQALTDDHWWFVKAAQYYLNGAQPLN